MKKYVLPDLAYEYSALEPHYAARLLEVHHRKHHAAYVAGANTTLEKLATARERRNFESDQPAAEESRLPCLRARAALTLLAQHEPARRWAARRARWPPPSKSRSVRSTPSRAS